LAAQTAQSSGAQAALFGTDDTYPEGAIRGTDLTASRAKVTLKLIAPGGKVTAEGSAEKMAYSATTFGATDAATRAAATEAARSMQPAFVAAWPSAEVVTTGGVAVHVTGLSRHAEYAALSRSLAALPGVGGVEPRRFARGEVDLFVRTASSASQIGAALERMPPSGVKVNASADGAGGLKVDVAAIAASDGG
jgi:hypothetical protein